jgi:hypothetical protein
MMWAGTCNDGGRRFIVGLILDLILVSPDDESLLMGACIFALTLAECPIELPLLGDPTIF